MSGTRGGAIAALIVVSAATAAGIGYIHTQQEEERRKLHVGVIRDRELLRLKEEQRRGNK